MDQIRARSVPLDTSLLHLQTTHDHRSWCIFNREIASDLMIEPRRCDQHFWNHIEGLQNEIIDQRVYQYIEAKGLGLVTKLGKQRLDHAIITAMVERWRPETHTFHFKTGEATITLQDVQILWGLPIDGPVVSGTWYSMADAEWLQLIDNWLGIHPQNLLQNDVKKGKIKISCLITEMGRPVGETEHEWQQRARVYMLVIMGGILFPDANRHDVPLSYIYNLIDLDPITGRLSWGSAVLACIYRNLCKVAASKDAQGINGAMLLLQHWVYERIPHLAPTLRVDIRHRDAEPITGPYGSRWHGRRTFRDTPSHVISTTRYSLTILEPGQFIWEPYGHDLERRLPYECTADRALWTYEGPIIFWATIETHLPDRVARQFGWQQTIPDGTLLFEPDTHALVHETSMRGKKNMDMTEAQPHDHFIALWNNRQFRIHQGVRAADGRDTVDEYWRWYYPKTVVHIEDPGLLGPANTYPNWAGPRSVYEEGITMMRNLAENQMQPNSQVDPRPFFEIPNHLLAYTRYSQPDRAFPYVPTENFNFTQPNPPGYDHTQYGPSGNYYTPPPRQRHQDPSSEQYNLSVYDYEETNREQTPFRMNETGGPSRINYDEYINDNQAEDLTRNEEPEPPQQQPPRRSDRVGQPRMCGTGGHLRVPRRRH